MERKPAFKPISWIDFQSILGELGFQLLSVNQEKQIARFGPKDAAAIDHIKCPVTVALPDFVAADGITPAYERDYVADLINQIFGGNGGKVLASFLAKR